MSTLPRPPVALRKSMMHMLVGNIAFMAGEAIILMSLARLADVTTVGIYVLALAVTAPLFRLAGLGGNAVTASDIAGKFAFQHYTALSRALNLAAIVGLALYIFASRSLHPYWMLFVPVALTKISQQSSELMYGVFQVEDRIDLVARSLLLRAGSAVLAVPVTMYLSRSALVSLWLYTALNMVIYVLHDYRICRQMRKMQPDFDWTILRVAARDIWPLAVANTIVSVGSSVPRLVVYGLLSVTDLALFGVAQQLFLFFLFMVNAMGRAPISRLARAAMNDPAQFGKLSSRLVAAGFCIGLLLLAGTIVLGKPLLGVAFGAKYLAAFPILVIVMLAAPIRAAGSMQQFALVALRRFPNFLKIQIGVLLIMAVSAYVGGIFYGIEGVALSQLAAAIFQVSAGWRDLRRFTRQLTVPLAEPDSQPPVPTGEV